MSETPDPDDPGLHVSVEAVAGGVDLVLSGPAGLDGTARIRSEDLELVPSGDAALVAALPLAMHARRALHVEAPVSPQLLAAVPTIQDVLAVWWFRDTERVEVLAEPAATAPAGSRHIGVVDGGIGSVHLLHADDPPEVGITVDHAVSRSGPGPRIGTDLAELGARFGLDWPSRYRGPASIASTRLVDGVGRIDLPAPFTVHHLFPWSSHAVLDPLWSGDGVEVRHRHADLDWVERLGAVVEVGARSALAVCTVGDGVDCGRCQPCVLRDAGLRVLGHGPEVDPRRWDSVDLRHHTDLADAAVLLRRATEAGVDDVAGPLRARIARLDVGDIGWPDNFYARIPELGSALR